MIIKRIKYSIVLLAVFFSFFNLAYAGLEITEIMYNPDGTDTNREWVKIHNNGNDTVTIIPGRADSAWRFSDDVDGTELHLINDELIIEPNTYAILASDKNTFISEYTEFNGPVADTSMSLSNISGTVRIWNGSNPRNLIASKEYPYSDNPIVNEDNDTNSTSNSDDIISSSLISNNPNDESKVYKITTKIISPKIVTAGVPFTIDHSTTGLKKEKIILGKFVWNFGDGMKKEGNTSSPFPYIYQYPGDYVLTLAYSDSTFDAVPDTTDRLVVKVIPASIIISSVGIPIDPFIEIENNSNYEMSLRGWIIKGSVHSFVIPEGMVVLPNKKLKLSPKITGFDFNDLNSISIIDQTGQIFATYPNKIIPTIKYSTSKNTNKTVFENVVKSDIVENNQIENVKNNSEIINLNDLGASASSSNDLPSLGRSFYSWLGLVGIIAIGIVSIIVLRRKSDYPDYVEGGVTANDMKIIE
jgi:hypothetical protein